MPRFRPHCPSFIRRAAGAGVPARLVWVALAVALPFMGYLCISGLVQARADQQVAHRSLATAARFAAARLDDNIANLRTLLDLVASSARSDVPGRDENVALLNKIWPSLTGRLDTFALWTPDGRSLGSLGSRASPGWSAAESQLAQRALASGEIVVQAPVMVDNVAKALFAKATRRPGGEPFVMIAAGTLRQYQARLDIQQPLARGAMVTVVNAHGEVVARTSAHERWAGASVGTPEQLNALRNSGVASLEGRSLDGTAVIVGHAPIRQADWLVFVSLPVESVLAPSRQRVRNGLLLGSGLLALGMLLAWRASLGITRPLGALRDGALKMAAGDLSHRHAQASVSELAQLSSALNTMADSLLERGAALRNSEGTLRELADSLPAAVALLDTNGRIEFANAACLAWFTQYQPDVGRHLCDGQPEAEAQRLQGWLDRALAGERVAQDWIPWGRQQHSYHVIMTPRHGADGRISGVLVMALNTTDRTVAEQALARNRQRLALAIEASGLGLFEWHVAVDELRCDAPGPVGWPSTAGEAVLPGRTYLRRVHASDRSLLSQDMRRLVAGDLTRLRAEYRVEQDDGSWRWVLVRAQVTERDAGGHALVVSGTQVDITERRNSEERLRQMAEHDQLTGLPNRRLFMDRLTLALERGRRHARMVAVMFVDVDGFKSINDTLGHAAGDQLLVAHAMRLRANLRRSDTVARLAGDEFTMILEDLESPAHASEIARQVVERARAPIMLRDGPHASTLSVGVALWGPADPVDGEGLLRRADAALYTAKRQGRNCHAVAGDFERPMPTH